MSTSTHQRKYTLNEEFFDTWSPKMAYVLGFWFADGCMRIEKSYRIMFSSNDFAILSDIRDALGSNAPITKNNHDQAFDFRVYSKKLYAKLQELGGSRRKSRIMVFPYVPKEYLRDFIRGYFDGDGSVFFTEYTRTKDGRRGRSLRTNFTSGSEKFLNDLMIILRDEINLPIQKLGVYNNGSSLKLGYGTRDSDTLLNYMYYEGYQIGLIRKAAFVFKIPKYQKHVMRRFEVNTTLF